MRTFKPSISPEPWAELPVVHSTNTARFAIRTNPEPDVRNLTSSTTAICAVCLDPEPSTRLIKSCGHHMCAPCLSKRLQFAIDSETFYPVQCCPRSLFKLDIETLDDQNSSLTNIAHELTTKMNKYDTPPSWRGTTNCCEAFMVQEERSGRAECTDCGHIVCKRCGEEYHGTSLCILDQERYREEGVQAQQKFEQLINEKCSAAQAVERGFRKRVAAIT